MQNDLLERASVLFEQKRFTESQKILNDILVSDPNNVMALIMIAEIKIQQENWDEALKLIENGIAIEPYYDVLFYLKARMHLLQDQTDKALSNINIAIEMDPYEANNFAFKGHVLLIKKLFSEALEAANQALEIDGSHIFALNVRSTALLKLNLKDDSFSTIQGALNEDPNNAYTHANYGWGLLEKGKTDDALKHFSESLKNDPTSEYAQAGMTEALKSKYFIYRWFLKYSFWMNNLTSKNQWAFIIGFFVVSRILRTTAAKNEALQPFLDPIIYLLAAFALSTWLMTPLSNLLFRLNKFGKHLLTPEEKKSSVFVGLSLLFLISGGILYLITQNSIAIAMSIFGFTMMLPLGRFYEKPAGFFKTYILGLVLLIILSFIQISQTGEIFNLFTTLYFIGFFVFQWAANYFSIRQN
ncbi:tetratricopeptide repeat protein [Flavobacterium soli]|uniref:tetratricopeptide repeat protein n=1 Tax=Flavobacterium soli TaxID=344881 RepID=UPI00041AA564|nr:hypothetical protein [Flavobacterium soli]